MSRSNRWCVVVLVGALLLAGCSGSGSGSSDTASPADDRPDPAEAGSGAPSGGDGDHDAVVEGLTGSERSHLVEGDTTWDVTYRDDATVVTGDALGAVVEADRSTGTFTFDGGAAGAAGLELAEGRVLLVAGQALGRITAVDDGGDRITVETEPASLADVIDDGTVAWDVPIRFDFAQFLTEPQEGGGSDGPGQNVVAGASMPRSTGQPQLSGISMALPDGRIVPVQSGADIGEGILDSIEVKPEDGAVEWTYGSHGNKYQFRLTAKGDAVDILVVVSRGGEGSPTMAFRGEGTIGSLRSVSSSSYEGGELAKSNVELQELASDLDLSLSVAGAGTSPVDFEIPVPMLTFTWLVGPVPVTLDLTAEIIGNVTAEANASATAKSSFTYRGSAGFAFGGASVSASGATDIDEMDPEPADSAAPMGLNVDAQFGLAFPSVSLSIFGQGLIPNLRTGAVIGSNLQWGGPAAGFPASSLCKSAYVRMEVSGGYDLVILGHTLAEEKFTLYEDENRSESDNCPEDDA